MRIALAQMFCHWGNVEANLASIERVCRRARQAGAELVSLPELCVCGMYKDRRVWDLAEPLDGPSVRRVLDLARELGLYVAFGFTERADGLPFNTYAVASPQGQMAGVYRKNFVAPLEVEFWQSHGERPVFDVAGRRFAAAICLDSTKEELLAHYGRGRAEAVLMPHAWDADPLDAQGRDLKYKSMAELAEHQRAGRLGGWKTHDQMRDQFYRYILRRARDNGFWGIFVNQCGQPHPALRIVGPTFAVDPRGRIVVETRDDAEQILYVDLP